MVEHYLDLLARTINRKWDQPALTDFYLTDDGIAQNTSRGNHYTYGEMYAEMIRLGEFFRMLSLQKGDHIAICGANSANWAIAYLAIAAYQGVAITILHSQSPKDIAQQINFSDAKILFSDADLWDEIKKQSFPQIEHVISLENWQILRGKEIPISNFQSPISNCQFSHGEPDNLALICFTSGSTGISKGVMLSNLSISNNTKDFHNLYPTSSNNNYLSLCPFAHLSGFMGDLVSQLTLGKHVNILLEIPHVAYVYSALTAIKPYMYISVPQVFVSLLHAYGETIFSDLLSFCKLIYVGGAPLGKIDEERIYNSPIPLAIVYGQTETGASIAISPYKHHRLTSCGKIVEGMTCHIASNGEILVKGENVMLGYYKNPEATARKIDKDGWLHTGDRGHLDEDGYLYVEGRLEQDMIVLPNGENIHPEEIERKINALPEVKESIVLARDGKLVAIVVKSDVRNQRLDISDIDLRRHILRTINPELPLYSQLCDVEITDTPLQKTEKQTLKRYLYK